MLNLQRLIATVYPKRRVAGHEVLAGGLINRNLKVHFAGDYPPVVLRVYRDGPTACAKEIAIHDLIHHDVPVAEIIHAETNGIDGSPAFAVLEYVEGPTFQQLKRTNNLTAINQAAADVGATLARIGHFQFPSKNQRTESTLVHNDFGNRNIMVREANGRWHVAAILDWEFAGSGSPLIDVGHFLRYERSERPLREPHFSRAYVEHGGVLPDNWELLVKLIDLTDLAKCLDQPDLPPDVAAEVLELIRATLRNESLQFKPIGELGAEAEKAVGDKCRASCVDWYGNARPLFLRGRVFALPGYELVEGKLEDGRLSELRRLNYAP